MKIVIPIIEFSKAGGYRVLSMLANSWAEFGHDVELIAMDKSKPYFPLKKEVHITYISANGILSYFRKLIAHLACNYDSYDGIIANHNLTAYCVYFACKRHKSYSKGYYYVQAYEPDFYKFNILHFKENVKKVLAYMSYNLPLKKIVNSDLYRNYKNLHSSKVSYPGLDLNNYYSKDISFFNDTIKIGTIGRTEEWKGTADVCKAMELLKQEGIPFEFYLAFNDFETIPHFFVKPDGDERLADFYRNMDIVVAVCKGQQGAIHYPIIETMAVGTSVICTDYYPSNKHNTYKVDTASPVQIVDMVKRIINNKFEAIKKREKALEDVQQFDWAFVARKFLAYITEDEYK